MRHLSKTILFRLLLSAMFFWPNIGAAAVTQTATALNPRAETSATEANSSDQRPLRVHRFRDAVTGRRVFSTDSQMAATSSGRLQRESAGLKPASSPTFYVFSARWGGTIPVFRFQADDGSMLFVADSAERSSLSDQGLQELPPVYVYKDKVEGSSEVHRVLNESNGEILLTTAADEKAFYMSRGWKALPRLGYAQADSSSGTGILMKSTFKLEPKDLPSIVSTTVDGKQIVFANGSRLAKLKVGQIIYSEKSEWHPFGLVRKVESIRPLGGGQTLVESGPASLQDAFAEVHLYFTGEPVVFLSRDDVDATGAPDPIATGFRGQPLLPEPEAAQQNDATPEYLTAGALVPSLASATLPNGVDFSVTVGVNRTLYSAKNGSLSVGGSLTLGATAEVMYNAYNSCQTSPTIIFLLTPRQTLTLTASASGQIASAKEVKVAGPFAATFALGGIPITAQADVFAGYDALGAMTAQMSVSETARMTAGVQYVVNTKNLTTIRCPSSCPTGFMCGPTPVTGATCALTASASGSFKVDASASVYVKPQLSLFAGAWGTGIGAYASTTARTRAELEPPYLNLYAELVPGVGAKLTAANCTIATISTGNLPPILSKKILSLPSAPPAPAGMTASDGTYSDKVLASSATAATATGYRWFRAASSTGTKTLLGSTSTPTFNDTTAQPGITFWYWVSGVNAYGEGRQSSADTGYRRILPPASVAATDGLYTDRVRITFPTSLGSSQYGVYRATSSTGTKTRIGTTTALTFDDRTGTKGVVYHYFITAISGRESAFSTSNTGYRK